MDEDLLLMEITPSPSQSSQSSVSSVSTIVNGPNTESDTDDSDVYEQMRRDARYITVNVGVQVNTETRTEMIATPAIQANHVPNFNEELEQFRYHLYFPLKYKRLKNLPKYF